jgi:2,4-dienoyl-CoA reductase-like NADH-dependent reductase (Old Yellow Enzyme family)
MVPPHGSAIGNLFGTEGQAEQHIAYFEARAKDGAAWFNTVRGRIRNIAIPGFEASGYGAETLGSYRQPNYVERVSEMVRRMHVEGAKVSSQYIVLGGVPHSPSMRLSAPVSNARPHVMTRDDIEAYLEEYRFSATQAHRAGLDALELHLNHDDLLEWFVSPLTNRRDDEYGGSFENRLRFAVQILRATKDVVGSDMAVGVRLNVREEMPGGYDVEDGIEIAQYLEATGMIDYVHAVIGSPWGDPSYIQPQFYDAAQWADLAGQVRKSISLPIVYAGKVTSLDIAEEVVAAGNADVVGVARAYIAEQNFITKAVRGRHAEIRPCIGGNDCISRQYAERLPFGCAVNPHVGTEHTGRGSAARRRIWGLCATVYAGQRGMGAGERRNPVGTCLVAVSCTDVVSCRPCTCGRTGGRTGTAPR